MSGSDGAEAWIRHLFATIDAQDADRFVGFLTEDAIFRFGSSPAVKGYAAVRSAVSGLPT